MRLDSRALSKIVLQVYKRIIWLIGVRGSDKIYSPKI